MINKKESGYGFAEPFYCHKTLEDLVIHYKETSLSEHNDQLDIKLDYPIYCFPMPPTSPYTMMH